MLQAGEVKHNVVVRVALARFVLRVCLCLRRSVLKVLFQYCLLRSASLSLRGAGHSISRVVPGFRLQLRITLTIHKPSFLIKKPYSLGFVISGWSVPGLEALIEPELDKTKSVRG